MAFHFNWSPLIADTDRVRHMLTSSLNRSPKPPIIVDDIIVNELNLGSTPPSLEILEIGDLAEDRFRGIFKVKYEGDAYLQLRTKVQANPLNTFLSTKPGFASPGPLAAGSGLTIPLQITLSDIRLSGFVILVFNKQKGITLVFRNDPLESLKVSSTFDTIPFVRDYLQRTIEEQLRVLFMEDLPAIIHRLSLRVFNSELDDNGTQSSGGMEQESAAGPDTSSAGVVQQDLSGGDLDIWSLSPFESSVEMYTAFSQQNLLKLAALNESQRTLSLFTPSIQDTVVRAWASAHERKEHREDVFTTAHRPTSLSRIQSQLSMPHSAWSSNASQTSDGTSPSTRNGAMSHTSTSTTYNLGMGRSRAHGGRKKKHRVVDLRRNKDVGFEGISDTVSVSSGYTESASHSGSISATGSTDHTSPFVRNTQPSSFLSRHGNIGEKDGEVHTPNTSPKKRVGFQQRGHNSDRVVTLSTEMSGLAEAPVDPHSTIKRHRPAEVSAEDTDATPRASTILPPQGPHVLHEEKSTRPDRRHLPRMRTFPEKPIAERSQGNLPRSASELSISDLAPAFNMQPGSSGGILEQAWMMKMATEIAKRVAEEKDKQSRSPTFTKWNEEERHDGEAPPPAYSS